MIERLRTQFVAVGCLALVLASVLSGCESGSRLARVEVVYSFENVRQTPSVDEWAKIREILNRYSTGPVAGDIVSTRSNAGTSVSNYKAVATLPNLRVIDKIQAELEDLAEERIAGTRIEFTLASLAATYRSNTVSAGVQVNVGGLAAPGAIIRVYSQPGAPAMETVASRRGAWTTPLNVIPDTRWVYGSSSDPSKVLPTRYFRINVATQQQDDLTKAEFEKLFPPTGPAPVSVGKKPGDESMLERVRDSVDQMIQDRRDKEELELKRRRDAEDRPKTGATPKKP